MDDNTITELEQSKYCYKGTKVLKNKRNIQDDNQLHEFENGVTMYKLSKLYLGEQPYKKSFDINHYLSIHKYLFDDIYLFAGELRDENIYKNNEPYKSGKTPFCEIPFIKEQLNYTLLEMKNNVRNIKNIDDLLTFISKYYLDLNIIHPFREGNGRTLREFIREYVIALNKILKFGDFKIDYNVDSEIKQMLKRASILDDIEKTKKVFSRMIIFEKERESKYER